MVAEVPYPDPRLKPCPFCAAHDGHVTRHDRGVEEHRKTWVYCGTCGAEGPPAKSLDKAIERWNSATRLEGEPSWELEDEDFS